MYNEVQHSCNHIFLFYYTVYDTSVYSCTSDADTKHPIKILHHLCTYCPHVLIWFLFLISFLVSYVCTIYACYVATWISPQGSIKYLLYLLENTNIKITLYLIVFLIYALLSPTGISMETTGCVDGFSQTIKYLQCLSNNRASNVLSLFLEGVENFGLTARVRCDHGMENILVACFMLERSGLGGVIVGVSVHNQIERLWGELL